MIPWWLECEYISWLEIHHLFKVQQLSCIGHCGVWVDALTCEDGGSTLTLQMSISDENHQEASAISGNTAGKNSLHHVWPRSLR